MKHILVAMSLALGSCCATAADLDASVITANHQREVIEQAAEVIQARYVDPALGRKVAQAIRMQANTDAFKHDREPGAFAQALTVELRKLSGDEHFRINYSAQPYLCPMRKLPINTKKTTPAGPAQLSTMASKACGARMATSVTSTCAYSHRRAWRPTCCNPR